MRQKILLVEDEVLLAMAKQQELARYNYQTSHVTSGEKAVDLVCNQDEPIDLILMDIDLGRGIDGTEAARQILEYKEIPIVFLSSHEEPEIVEKTEKITSYGYVVKSSSITVLDASIKMAFKLYESSIREKKQENELRRNEERLSLAMDATEHGFWDWKITTGNTYFSPRWYTMLGYEPGELPMVFDTWVDLLHPDSKDVIDHLNHYVKNAEPFTEEFQLRCKDGSYKWIMGQGKSYEFNRENHPTRVVGIHTDITERKKYEDALRLSEELLNETGKMVKTGGWEVDVANGTVYWTKATKAIYEVPEDFEPTIDGAMSNFPGESGVKLREAYRRALEHGVDYDLELDFITAKGNALKVRDIGRAVFKDGKCHKVYGVFQDITETKYFEQKLKESEEKYKAAQAAAHVGSWEYDIKTNSFWGSEEGKRIYGFHIEKDKFTAESVMECVIEKERVEQAMTDLVEHNIPYDIEFTIFPRNSTETRTIHSIAVLEKDVDGNPSKVTGTLHDITELRKSYRSAENEKAFLNTVLDNIREAIIICDQSGHIIRFNESARKLHHLPEKPIPPEQWPEYYDLYYSDGSTLLATEDIPLFRALKGDDVVDIEIVVTPKSTGISHLLSCNGHQLINNEGELVGAVVAMHDITEQREAEKKISAASEEKDYLMKELNHRVKNNLLMVSSLIHLKDMETEIDLSDIQHQINSISLIHEQLYQSESVTEISCQDYFESLLDSIFSSFTRGKVKIENRIEDLYLTTKTAETLGLIINEIATNAIKHGFTDKEEAVFLIKMKKDINNTRYELNLSNTGKPFPKDVDIERTKTFGLHLINVLVAQLNGTVELQRKPNPMFTIRFPLED